MEANVEHGKSGKRMYRKLAGVKVFYREVSACVRVDGGFSYRSWVETRMCDVV